MRNQRSNAGISSESTENLTHYSESDHSFAPKYNIKSENHTSVPPKNEEKKDLLLTTPRGSHIQFYNNQKNWRDYFEKSELSV